MSPRAKGLLRAAVQILLTAAALVVVSRAVRWYDVVQLRGAPPIPARSVEVGGGVAVIVMPDGRRESVAASHVERIDRGLRSIWCGGR